MIDFKETIATMGKEMVALSLTTKLTKEHVKIPKWYMLKHQYEIADSVLFKKAVTVLNAILTQDRVIFILTEEGLRKLLASDANLDSAQGANSSSHKAVIKLICNSGLVKCIIPRNGRQPNVFEVVDPDILKLLIVNRDQQLKEAQEFIGNRKTLDNSLDKTLDNSLVVGVREEEGVRLQAPTSPGEEVAAAPAALSGRRANKNLDGNQLSPSNVNIPSTVPDPQADKELARLRAASEHSRMVALNPDKYPSEEF